MALDTSIFSADLAEMIADLPQSITFDGVAYSCSADDEGLDAELELPGYRPSNAVRVTLLKTTYAMPSIGKKCTYAGRTYKVANVQESPDTVSYRVELEDA